MHFKSKTEESKYTWKFMHKFEIEWNEYQRQKKIQKQIKDLEAIKEKMIETKLKHECMKLYKKKKPKYEEEIEELFRRNFDITLTKGKLAKALYKIFETKNILNKYNMRQIDNRLKIIKKLADEFGICNKKKPEPIIQKELSFGSEKGEEEETTSFKDLTSSSRMSSHSRSRSRTSTGRRHRSSKGSFRRFQFGASKRKSSGSRPSTEITYLNALPDFRVVLPPEHIPVSVFYKKNKIIDEILKDEHEFDHLSGIGKLENENDIVVKPSIIKFNDYHIDNIYSQKIVVHNRSPIPIQCTLIDLKYIDLAQSNPFQIELNDKLQSLYGYMSFPMKVVFQPKERKTIQATIIFHTVRPDCKKKKLEINIECRPIFNDLIINPTTVKFEDTPFWKFDKISLKKYITLKNNFTRTIYIRIARYHRNTDRMRSSVSQAILDVAPEYECFTVVKSLLDKLLKRVSNVFDIFTTFIEIPPRGFSKIPCICKNISSEGVFVDYFKFFLYSDTDCNDLIAEKTIKTEISCSGYKFEFSKQHIDFKICVINFGNYQDNISVINKSNTLLKCMVKVPKSMKDFISVFPVEGFILAKSSQIFYIRFSPGNSTYSLNRLDLESSRYYNSILHLLNFPLKMYISSSEYKDLKPPKIPIYAVIYIPSIQIEINNEGVIKIINLGRVTTKETVLLQLRLYNTSILSEEYGFLNLPSYIHIHPGYGFGKIYPNEFFDFVMFYSPDVDDMINTESNLPNIIAENNFQIKVYTVYKDAKEPTGEGCRSSYDKPGGIDMTVAYFKSYIINPLFEFDYQYIRTKCTPCGSFSLSIIHLRLNESIKRCLKRKNKNLQGTFMLDTDSEEIQAQPRLGTLTSETKSIKIVIQCSPKVPSDLYKEVAKQFKQGSPREKKQPTSMQPRFDVVQSVWKYLKPYTLDVTIRCHLKYTHIPHDEMLMCRVVCPVVKPNFILSNLTSQKIVFGGQPIGLQSHITVLAKNITMRKITLNIPHLNPKGPFKCNLSLGLTLLPFEERKFKISFEPITNTHYYEYMEIQSELTLVPLALVGYGIAHNISWTSTLIHRGTYDNHQVTPAKAVFEIRNFMECDIPITIDVGLRLKGCIPSDKNPKNKAKIQASKPGKTSTQKFTEIEEKCISTFETSFREYFTHRVYGVQQKNFTIKAKSKAVIFVAFEKPSTSSSLTSYSKLHFSQTRLIITNAYLIKYNLLMGKKFLTDFIYLVNVKN